MASISYTSNNYHFTRSELEPVSEEEYALIKKNYDSFLDNFIKNANAEYERLPNPHRFNWKLFLILIGTGVIFLAVDLILKAMDYYDAGEIFAVLSFFPFFIVFIQPIQYVLASSRGAGNMARYEQDAEAYFDFHASKISPSKNYPDYRMVLSTTTLDEVTAFVWKNG